MREEEYRRPRLCRFCECPAVDGGVRLRKPNMEKLSLWTKAHWDTDIRVELKNFIVCHFCDCDLRFVEEHSELKESSDQIWWPRYEKHNNVHHKFFKYYTDEWTKPCSVQMTPLANEDKLLKEYRQRGFGQRHRCLHCPQSYAAHQNLVFHAQTLHPDKFFYCRKMNCGKFFHTEEEKAEHIKKEHQAKKESLKCVYCGKVYTNFATLKVHLLKHHRSQIIRCPNYYCKQMFKTTEERDKHFENLHNSGKYFCCFCDRYFENYKAQWMHMKRYHKKKALKCNATRNCPNYFKTEEDWQKHVLEKHSENYKCIYCDTTYFRKSSLGEHIKLFHKEVALRCEYTHQCSTWFKTEKERQKHYEEDHEKGEDKVLCPFCNKKFSKHGIIGAHFRTHHKKEKILKCDYTLFCSNYFKCEEDKLKHVQEVHKTLDEKFRCVYCR